MNAGQSGPFSYENWKRFNKGLRLRQETEYPLFTDAHIIGEVTDKYGPYQLLNTVAARSNLREFVPAITLRVQQYLNPDNQVDMKNSNTERYHGGTLSDELAALISLCMGVRIKAGGPTRYFTPEGDPKGHPINWFMDQTPYFPKNHDKNLILPKAIGTHNLEKTNLIQHFSEIDSYSDAIALIRAARLYQDAIWIIESNPNLAWLLLVSSIEIAANQWFQLKNNKFTVLKETHPDLIQFLQENSSKKVILKIAEEFAPLLRSGKKFRDFIIHFLPEPPLDRPEEVFQISWKKRDIKKALVKIYNYRSRSLHGGIPFPLPMCMPPLVENAEKPTGLASSAHGGVWLAKDAPMLIHIFEHIVRNSLLGWWESILPSKEGARG